MRLLYWLLINYVFSEENYIIPHYYGSRYKDFDPTDPNATSFYWSYQYHPAPDGSLWLADATNSEITAILETSSLPLGAVTHVLGLRRAGFRDGDIAFALLNKPNALTFYQGLSPTSGEEANYVFIADTHNHCIRQLDLTALEI